MNTTTGILRHSQASGHSGYPHGSVADDLPPRDFRHGAPFFATDGGLHRIFANHEWLGGFMRTWGPTNSY